MAAPKRGKGHRRNRKFARDEALAETSRLYKEGHTYAEIAVKLGVSSTAVSNDMKIIKARYTETLLSSRAEMVAIKLEQYRAVMKEAWEAWRQSKKNKHKVMTGSTQVQTFVQAKEQRTIERQTGNATYLSIVASCLQAERELLGLDAPKKSQVTGAILDWDKLLLGLAQGEISDPVEQTIAEVMGLEKPKPVEMIEKRLNELDPDQDPIEAQIHEGSRRL